MKISQRGIIGTYSDMTESQFTLALLGNREDVFSNIYFIPQSGSACSNLSGFLKTENNRFSSIEYEMYNQPRGIVMGKNGIDALLCDIYKWSDLDNVPARQAQ